MSDAAASQAEVPAPLEHRIPRRVLLGPGPSDVDPRVAAAMARPLVGHLDPFFVQIMGECQAMLRRVFRTTNQVTFPVSGTGSAGMEACVVNLVEPGDQVVVCVNGVFGARMVDVAERAGARVASLTRPWGETFSPDEIQAALRRHRPKVLGLVHAETSTGAWQELEEIGRLCREAGTLLLVDCVTSLGGVPVQIDATLVDAAYSGTQKCLSAPPGLSPVTFGPRALEAMERRKTKVQSWYLDVSMVRRYWGDERFYHHTAPISMIYGLHEALRLVLEEGLGERFSRHARHHRALRAGLAALGLSLIPKRSLPMLNAVHVPEGIDEARVRKELLAGAGIEIGGGLGDFKGRAWRIGLMGYSAREEHVLAVLDGVESALAAQGHKRGQAGSARAAAMSDYAAAWEGLGAAED